MVDKKPEDLHDINKASNNKEKGNRIIDNTLMIEHAQRNSIVKGLKDAEENAGEDKKRRELVESRNNAESLAYSTEKMLSESNDKISEEDKKAIEDAIAEVRKVLENQEATIEEIDSSKTNLETASHKLSQAMYEEASKQANADSEDPSANTENGNKTGGDDGDVVDAEFEEVKKDK